MKAKSIFPTYSTLDVKTISPTISFDKTFYDIAL